MEAAGSGPVTQHDHHGAHPPHHVSETRVRATGVSQPGFIRSRLLDGEADEIGETFEMDRRETCVLVLPADGDFNPC